MPGGDGTGPMGMGSMTGRGAGYCAGYPDIMPGRDLGLGLGRGLRRGRGYMGNGPGFMRFQGNAYRGVRYYQGSNLEGVTPEQEADALKRQAKFMQDEITAINKRVNELESPDKTTQ